VRVKKCSVVIEFKHQFGLCTPGGVCRKCFHVQQPRDCGSKWDIQMRGRAVHGSEVPKE
jgi:hypothetical protein